jgi:hypothetical protein
MAAVPVLEVMSHPALLIALTLPVEMEMEMQMGTEMKMCLFS